MMTRPIVKTFRVTWKRSALPSAFDDSTCMRIRSANHMNREDLFKEDLIPIGTGAPGQLDTLALVLSAVGIDIGMIITPVNCW